MTVTAPRIAPLLAPLVRQICSWASCRWVPGLVDVASTTSSPASTAATMNPIFSVLRRSRDPRPPEATITQMPSLHRDQHSNAANSFPRLTRPQVFFGRDDELKTIINLIFSSASAARIAILGPGGIGKTVLAHAVLTNKRVVSGFGDSRYFVPCEFLTS